MTGKSTSFLLSLLACIMLVIPACEWWKKVVSPTDETSTAAKFYLLDVNTKEVYDDAHIAGAQHVSIDDLENSSKEWSKEASITVYCSPACGTKEFVAEKLETLGFKSVTVFPGGIVEWYKLSKENKAEYPLEGEAKGAYLQKDEVAMPKEGIVYISAEEVSKRLTGKKN